MGATTSGSSFDKLLPLWRNDPGIALRELEGVTAPTLVLFGDDGVASLEQAAALQSALPSCQSSLGFGSETPFFSPAVRIPAPPLTARRYPVRSVRPGGFEPPTSRSGGARSIP